MAVAGKVAWADQLFHSSPISAIASPVLHADKVKELLELTSLFHGRELTRKDRRIPSGLRPVLRRWFAAIASERSAKAGTCRRTKWRGCPGAGAVPHVRHLRRAKSHAPARTELLQPSLVGCASFI
jgi:hypothetical protein